MKYKIINQRDSAPEVNGDVISHEETVAMDIVDSFPEGTDLQTLYKEVHLRVAGYTAWRVKAEIHVLLNRRQGIESSYVDYRNEEFEVEDFKDLVEIRKAANERFEASSRKLDEVLRNLRLKGGI